MSPLYKKLLGWFLAANLVVLLVSVFVTDRIGRHVAVQEPDWGALAADTVAAYERNGLSGLAAHADRMRSLRHIEVLLFEDGYSLLQQGLPPQLLPFLPQLLASDALVLQADPQLWMAARAVTTVHGERLHFVALRGPPPPHARRGLLLLVQIALTVLAIAALGFVLARSLTAPIAAMQAATRRMAAGDLAARADASATARGDELGALARDFNHMAERTETLMQQQRTVLRDVSHELRSPLARLHLLLELARGGASEAGSCQLDRAATEVGRLDALIGEVLALSRLETALPGLAMAPVALDALLRQLVDEQALDAEARRIVVEPPAAHHLIVQGDAVLLARAVGNALSNAIKFSPEGGRVWLTAAPNAGMAEITVRDEGPGVAPAELDALFTPFYRGDNGTRAEGHGLGLAITQRIVRAHGGVVSAENAAGGGLVLRIRLPLPD